MQYKKNYLLINDNNPRTLCELSKDDYEVLHEINQSFSEYQTAQQPLSIIFLNLAELQRLESDHNDMILQGKDFKGSDIKDAYIEFNRLLMNYLFSVRQFQDFSEGSLKRWFGSESEELRKYKQFTAEIYDNHPEYRFLYAFRNYVQHYSLPVDALEFSQSVEKNQRKLLKVVVLKEKLLANSERFNKQVGHDIQILPDKIDLLPIIREYNGFITNIAAYFAELSKGICNQKLPDFERIMKPFSGLSGTAMILRERLDDNTQFSYEVLLVDIYRSIRVANGG